MASPGDQLPRRRPYRTSGPAGPAVPPDAPGHPASPDPAPYGPAGAPSGGDPFGGGAFGGEPITRDPYGGTNHPYGGGYGTSAAPAAEGSLFQRPAPASPAPGSPARGDAPAVTSPFGAVSPPDRGFGAPGTGAGPYGDPYAGRSSGGGSWADPSGASPAGDRATAPGALFTPGAPVGGPTSPSRAGTQGSADQGDIEWPPRRRPEQPAEELQGGPGKPRRRRLVIAGALSVGAVVIVGVTGGALYLASQDEAPASATAATPSPTITVDPTRPSGRFGYAASRATDPQPLTRKELFGHRKLTVGKRHYTRTIWRADKKCADGVTGTKITAAVKRAGCSQILRASYQDAKGEIIATIGVANLKTTSGAKKVTSAGAGSARKDYVKALPGKSGATQQLGKGEALAGAWTHGHYSVLVWCQFKDGHRPTTKERKRLNQASSDILDGTVYPALDTRSLTGGHG